MKTPKPLATRKPPLQSESHAEIDDWLRRVMPDLHPIVESLDGSFRQTIPGLRYAVKWKRGVLRATGTRMAHRDGGL